MSDLSVIVWAIATYLIASIPFAVVIGYVVFKTDIRQYGDHNPGATNVLRASHSKFWFIVAVFLDGAKGLFPAGILYWLADVRDMRIVLVAFAALLGHAYPIFTRFRGGKAVAITGGIWTGLTFEAPFVIGIMLTYWFLSVDSSDWAVILMMLSFLLYLILAHNTQAPFFLFWLLNFLVLVVKHRDGLRQRPGIKRWLPFLPRSSKEVH